MPKTERKIFYKKRLVADPNGLSVVTDRFVSIHETRCYHFCVLDRHLALVEGITRKGETPVQYARRQKLLKRINKAGSRIAFETEGQALECLRLLKRRQLDHVRREEAFIVRFLEAEELEERCGGLYVPDSKQLVEEHYFFY